MRTRWLVAGAMLVVGLVWIGQGTGLLAGSSAMVGDITWAFVGVALVAPVLAIVVWSIIRRPRA